MATSATTRTDRNPPRHPRATVRLLPFIASCKSGREAVRAGARPASTPAASVTAEANNSTGVFTRIVSGAGSRKASRTRRTRTSHQAPASPRTPPAHATSKLSPSSRRNRRVRPAPSAARNASSPVRAEARASWSPAMLAQIRSNTMVTAPQRTNNGRRTAPESSSERGAIRMRLVRTTGAMKAGKSAMCRRSMASRSDAASAGGMPSRGRPIMWSSPILMAFHSGGAEYPPGTSRSARRPPGNRKPRGRTPVMV